MTCLPSHFPGNISSVEQVLLPQSAFRCLVLACGLARVSPGLGRVHLLTSLQLSPALPCPALDLPQKDQTHHKGVCSLPASAAVLTAKPPNAPLGLWAEQQ